MIHRFIIINELGIRQIDSQLTRSHLELQTIALLRLSFVVNIGLRVSICCTILSFNDKSRVNIANVQWIRIAHHRRIINCVNYIFCFNYVVIQCSPYSYSTLSSLWNEKENSSRDRVISDYLNIIEIVSFALKFIWSLQVNIMILSSVIIYKSADHIFYFLRALNRNVIANVKQMNRIKWNVRLFNALHILQINLQYFP